MADYTFDTSGDLSEAFKIKPVEEQTQEMITPSAEETEARHEREAQEREENEEKIGEAIASRRPYLRRYPDLLTMPTVTGGLDPAPPKVPTSNIAGPAPEIGNTLNTIWQNMKMEETTLEDAQEWSKKLGVTPQFLIDNQELLKEAKERDTLLTINDILPGNNWLSPQKLDEYYPELAKFRQENPVGAALALRNHRDLNDTRSIFERIGDAFDSAAELFGDAFNSGSDMVKLYDAQMRAVNGEDMAAVKPEVDEITQRLKEYQEEDRPTTALG